MNILVCITHVPDTTSKIKFSGDGTQFDASNVQFVIGPYDEYALSKAIDLREKHGGKVTVLNVGKAETEPTIRKALAIGADDAIRIDADPTDAFFVAEQIVSVAKGKSYDLIMMGRESIDYNGGLVHGFVGEMLNVPAFSPVMEMEINESKARITREIDGGKEYMEVDLPFVAGCQEPVAEWKIPNMRGIMSARTKPLEVVAPSESGSGISYQKFELPPEKGAVTIIDADNIEELVKKLKNEAKII